MKNITKLEFYEKLREDLKIKYKDSKLLTDELIASLIELIENNNRVNIKNFGKFRIVSRKARKVFNPKKKQYINIPESKIIKFTNKKNILLKKV